VIAALAFSATFLSPGVISAPADGVGLTEDDIRDALYAVDRDSIATREKADRRQARRAGVRYYPLFRDTFASHNIREIHCSKVFPSQFKASTVYRCSYEYTFAGPLQGEKEKWAWEQVIRTFAKTAKGWRFVTDKTQGKDK
jgi:hypothetical protein